MPGFPGELCWGSAAADDLKKLKGLKENLAMLRELHEANKKTVSQAGRAFRVHATLNGGLTQSLLQSSIGSGAFPGGVIGSACCVCRLRGCCPEPAGPARWRNLNQPAP